MPRSSVAVVSTTPETVLEDIRRCLVLAGCRERIRDAKRVTLCVDAAWNHGIPGTHTQPWQLDGVLAFLRAERFPVEQIQMLVSGPWGIEESRRVLEANHLWPVMERAGVALASRGHPRPVALGEGAPTVALLCPQGLSVPDSLRDGVLFLLPSIKTHVRFGLGGAMTQLASTLLPDVRVPSSHAPNVQAELLRLLPGLETRPFVLADGTVCGDGAGPRTIRPSIQNLMLAGGDPVACDATTARILGWEPRRVAALRRAFELDAGPVDPGEIEVRGEDVRGLDLGFESGGGASAWAERSVETQGPPWSRLARGWQESVWLPTAGRRVRRSYAATPWGKLLRAYREGALS